MRCETQYYKSKSDKNNNNMRTEVVGGDTRGISMSRMKEMQTKSYKASKGERAT